MEFILIHVKGHNAVDFAVDLASFRKDFGLTQTELADLCNVSKNTISSIECGKFLPGLPLLIKLCLVLSCNFSDLVKVWDCEELDYIKL